MEIKNTSYHLSINKYGTQISGKDITYQMSIKYLDEILYQNILKKLISSKKATIQLIIDNKYENSIGYIDYRFGYQRATDGFKQRDITRVILDIVILKEKIQLKILVYATAMIFECSEIPNKDEIKEFNEEYLFEIPFEFVPKVFNLNHKDRFFFLDNGVSDYIKCRYMERVKNKYGKLFYIFQDEEDECFFVEPESSLSIIARIDKAYKSISEYSCNKNAPEYITQTSYYVHSHLLSIFNIKNILLNYHFQKIVSFPLRTVFEGDNLGKLYYSYGTDINEENKAPRKIEKINLFVEKNKFELLIKIKVVASPINYNDLDRELTYIELNKHIEKFHLKIPFEYLTELFDMNQEEIKILNLNNCYIDEKEIIERKKTLEKSYIKKEPNYSYLKKLINKLNFR